MLSINRKTFAISSSALNFFASQIGEFFLPHPVFTTKSKQYVHSVEKRDYEKCIIYDRLLKHCCDVISGHIYCPRTYSAQQDRQCTYKRNIGGPLHNHSCRGKTIRTTYSEYVLVALGIQHSKCMHHIFVWPVPFYNIFLIISQNGTIF